MLDFTNKVVLITGSSRGIGRSIAKLFAEQGARVVVHFHSNEGAAEETLSSLPGEGHFIVQGDIADPDAVARIVDQVVARAERLDVLIYNAAIYEDHPLAEVDYETWQQSWRATIDTNLAGRGESMLLRRPTDDLARGRTHRQRVIAGSFPWRADRAGLRRQQGGLERDEPIAS